MTSSNRTVTLGVTRLLESERGILQGMRVGLIVNRASMDESGIPTAPLLLDAGINVACLFSPEHGYDASAGAGDTVGDSSDPKTGLPVHSLYGATRQPTADMLRDIDAIVFDLQDVGTRCYTYIWTMALALQAAALFGRLFVVLDRPNPIGGVTVQGPMLDPAFASFLGMYPIPLRHGMTAGELAIMFNQSFGIGADLAVVRMYGWRRRLWFSDTGLRWTPPSPAIRSPEGALAYAGTCIFEGTNISEGRGTASPFRLIGAPWLDPDVLGGIDNRWSAGFALSPRRFTPTESKHAGAACVGFAIDVVDKECADPVALAAALLTEIAARHPDKVEWKEKHFDAVAGTDTLRHRICAAASLSQDERNREIATIFQSWEEAHRAFEKLRSPHLLYEG